MTNFQGTLRAPHALIMINPSIGWFEVFKTAGSPAIEETSELFDLHWFCQHPRQEIITCGMGTGFSSEFAE